MLEEKGEGTATVPLVLHEARKARDHRVVVALALGWVVSVALLGVAVWSILPI